MQVISTWTYDGVRFRIVAQKSAYSITLTKQLYAGDNEWFDTVCQMDFPEQAQQALRKVLSENQNA